MLSAIKVYLVLWTVACIIAMGAIHSPFFKGDHRNLVLLSILLTVLFYANVNALWILSKRTLGDDSYLDRVLVTFGLDVFLTLLLFPYVSLYVEQCGIVFILLIWWALKRLKRVLVQNSQPSHRM